ncbi:hypothetical protein [Mucilaginibacter glaciei]|uniref:Uncharacterized protein n=1 Tax=Mucilaginibacter glaciei TaxID=2772109 RepID=A0A926NTH1_9SPHI|nr:hypothetical protein [Mucilaginibacter glaciei]MBD1394415.1 hypothetical protein [Mucilaginibacter glaciei]
MKKFIYKHIQIIALFAMMIISGVSCRRGNSTTISMRDDNNSQTIEYSGRVVFGTDHRSIESISKKGYVKFERNGKKVGAEAGTNGKISYEFDGGSPVQVLDEGQKLFVADAVQTIIKERSKLQAIKN